MHLIKCSVSEVWLELPHTQPIPVRFDPGCSPCALRTNQRLPSFCFEETGWRVGLFGSKEYRADALGEDVQSVIFQAKTRHCVKNTCEECV
ncbi:hypothetical protein AOLI_G00309100 [Acnodon oligacanthus]